MSALKALVAGLFFLSFDQPVVSQTTYQGNILSIDQLINNLENKYPVRFFYKPEWFENKKIDSLCTRLKLEDALSHVESLCHLSYYLIDKRSIVFVSYQTSLYSSSETK